MFQILVGRGNFKFKAGNLAYENNIWEHPPARNGIIGTICVIALLSISTELVCRFCKPNRRCSRDSERGRQMHGYIKRARLSQSSSGSVSSIGYIYPVVSPSYDTQGSDPVRLDMVSHTEDA